MGMSIRALGLDVKFGVRMLIKYPGLALVGVFGIGVAVAIAAGGFSVIYGSSSSFRRRPIKGWIRATLNPEELAVDPDLQLRNMVSLDEALPKEQWVRRLEATVRGAVSLSVLMLSSAGIYALMWFTVSQRQKEIGIRMALGADRMRILASIFSRAVGQLALGAALGAAMAAALEKASGDNMMRGNAPVVLPAGALCMMAVGILAALAPARRCLGIEPTEALREQ